MKFRIVATACLLLSCASPQEETSVSSSHQPTSRYDGDWRAIMHDTELVQQIQGYRFDCAPFTEPFFLRVRKGIASGFMEADENYSFTSVVNNQGRFKATIPTNTAYSYKEVSFDRESSIVLVLKGDLSTENRTGLFVIGDEAIGSQGCMTQVRFVAL